ncbi:hypothetical protein SLEP1_g13442 [Rubroshorea leprosula]|uniref:Uncharacterized protein n=1 Tax=Rubroshorea leprosula TaxID=152421 RepID=A0AAV5ISC8_9ROSI|nr:hypothetical protein SLEP1_g13442 [Rubroshorea leprosula]
MAKNFPLIDSVINQNWSDILSTMVGLLVYLPYLSYFTLPVYESVKYVYELFG